MKCLVNKSINISYGHLRYMQDNSKIHMERRTHCLTEKNISLHFFKNYYVCRILKCWYCY